MERESLTRQAGFAGILSRLADVVAALIVRGWVENGCGERSGLVQAMRDPTSESGDCCDASGAQEKTGRWRGWPAWQAVRAQCLPDGFSMPPA
ncbi:Uncharacterised protein [Pantoea agglomerans]|uniref:Uncharacterized protein n=1 Tax=Enterobacter agglomerans TaxID=549 RepID=A0A379AMY6_ENTAG|nr:Uncharacterised protein [Pantoea agglomerans]